MANPTNNSLAGIKDIIEPDVIVMAEHTSWFWLVVILLFVVIMAYFIHRWMSPLFKARRRYKNIIRHQHNWAANTIGAEIIMVMSDRMNAESTTDDTNTHHYQQLHMLCDQLRFSGVPRQPDISSKALELVRQSLWPVK